MLIGFGSSYIPLVLGGVISALTNYHQSLLSFNTIGANLAVSGGYWAAAFVLRRVLKIDWQLRSMRDVFRLLTISLVSSCAVAFAGVLMGVADHAIKRSEYLHASITWWVGDAVTLSSLTPFLLVYEMPWLLRYCRVPGAKAEERPAKKNTLRYDSHTVLVWIESLLLILDQEMPGLGGIELVEMLRKGPALPSLPVILMLSRPLESKARLECERLGIARTILKPIRRAWLFEALQQTVREPKSEPAPTKIEGSTRDGVKLRILVVDDNLVNQRLISRLLEKMGHQVLVASDGMAVLRILGEREVNFIAMDMQMPVLDGVETTRKIRAMEKGAGGHVPIVAMTANAFEEGRRKCFEAGMDGFVVKPVSAQSIRDEMERVLALQVVTAEKDAAVRRNP